MSLRILVDMNLSADWIPLLTQAGWPTVHWSAVGDPRADDQTIMAWAVAHAHAVFTHDLDFGAALALTHTEGPSVIQIRSQQVLPEHIGPLVTAAISQFAVDLSNGALVVIERRQNRVRVLPL